MPSGADTVSVESPFLPVDHGCEPAWTRIDLEVCNTANTYAKAHPLVVLGALFMAAAPASLKPEHRPRRFLFRLRDAVGDRVRLGHRYRVSLLLPDATEAETEEFLAGLSRRFARLASSRSNRSVMVPRSSQARTSSAVATICPANSQ